MKKDITRGWGKTLSTPLQSRIKLRDMLKYEFCADVGTRDFDVNLGALEAPIKLTEHGLKKYKDILDLDVILLFDIDDFIFVELPQDDMNVTEDEYLDSHHYQLLQEFVSDAAGDCSEKEYDKLFITEEENNA